MRPLTEQETQTLFKKLANYTGSSLKDLIAPLTDDPSDRMVFRLVRDRVYYVRLSVANLATNIARDKLLSLGTCIGANPLPPNNNNPPPLYFVVVVRTDRRKCSVADRDAPPVPPLR